MKTQIITLFAALVLGSAITNATYAATAKKENVTVLTDVSAINKIEVRGNVVLYISDGATDQVKVYSKYYSESAVVKSRNGVLSIASYKAQKLVVWVTAADLRSISAYDNSEVKSFGDLSKIDFDIDLHDNASANLNLDAFSADITVNDFARVDLTGSANYLKLSHNFASTVNDHSFKAEHFTENRINFPADLNKDMAGI